MIFHNFAVSLEVNNSTMYDNISYVSHSLNGTNFHLHELLLTGESPPFTRFTTEPEAMCHGRQ